MMCPNCKKYFCEIKAFNDYQIQFYREVFNHNPSFCFELPKNAMVTCPHCKLNVEVNNERNNNF